MADIRFAICGGYIDEIKNGYNGSLQELAKYVTKSFDKDEQLPKEVQHYIFEVFTKLAEGKKPKDAFGTSKRGNKVVNVKRNYRLASAVENLVGKPVPDMPRKKYTVSRAIETIGAQKNYSNQVVKDAYYEYLPVLKIEAETRIELFKNLES